MRRNHISDYPGMSSLRLKMGKPAVVGEYSEGSSKSKHAVLCQHNGAREIGQDSDKDGKCETNKMSAMRSVDARIPHVMTPS